MNQRALLTTILACFGGAAILAIAALLAFAGVIGMLGSAWVLLVAGALLAASGANVQKVTRAQADSLKRAHDEGELIRTQLQRQRSAVDSLADGLEIAIFICEPKAEILYANRRAMEMFRSESPIGRSILAITLSYDLEQLVLEAFRQQLVQRAEMPFSYPVERVAIANAWPEDFGERVFLSLYEITDLRRLERIRQDFVSNVSHELRTPLTIIRSMTETLLDDKKIDEALARRYLPQVIDEVDRLSLISNDLLILSAAESNPVRKQRCDLSAIFRSTLEQLTPKAKEKGLELHFEGPQSLVVEANSAQMTQVAINLIDNALNYSPQGSVTVRVHQEETDGVVEVVDTGIGIPSEHLPRIFERFYRVDKARSRGSGGTGLGLSIVKHIVESHGGRVSVDSALNEGSSFTIVLPIGNPVGDE